MKLNSNQLITYISNSFAAQRLHFFWINSEDIFLLNETTRQLRAAIKSQGYTERIIIHVDQNTNWSEINNTVTTPNLFDDKQLIEINFISKLSIDQQQELNNLARISKKMNSLCVITYPFKLDSKTLKQKWMLELEQNGVITTIWPLSEQEYPAWLKNRCQKNQLQFSDNNVFDYFCQKTSCNPGAAAQIIYKLKLQEIAIITSTIIQGVIAEQANYDIFDLTDNYLLRNTKKCITIINTLKNLDTEPLLILWSLRKELKILADIHESAHNTKQSVITLLEKYHFWQNKKNIMAAALKKFDLDLIYKSLSKVAELELLIKTENTSTFIWQQIYELILINIVEFSRGS